MQTAWGADDAFVLACNKLAATAKVKVSFLDVPLLEDNAQSVATLKGISGKAADQNHSVFGLTHAEPAFGFDVNAQSLTAQDGRVCMAPTVKVKLTFTELKVYLAKEMHDACRKQIVRAHEMEHVAAWRSHFRIGAVLMAQPLQLAFSTPRYYANKKQAEEDLSKWVGQTLAPWQQKLLEGLAVAQRAIDSPASYASVQDHLRTCPPSSDELL